jgi:hypothetical protein
VKTKQIDRSFEKEVPLKQRPILLLPISGSAELLLSNSCQHSSLDARHDMDYGNGKNCGHSTMMIRVIDYPVI